ncbi:unnamed protein product [Tuber melanosporum]|uniref:(Perigord truffle) hypothetical protein n=1 Tax=Tuber melanosporum (strain Mel28) TaxID=656061 RepID=D5GIV7_TUBMM|nr:uncharacterized protein GSTUM_00008705001 [Tuber melanosporum]CAZ84450.1 unnamed protein product [Tuber melanosporum]
MLGHHSKHKDELDERKKQEGKKKQDERGGYYDTPSQADELHEPQTVYQTPRNPAPISGYDRIGRKGGRHGHHGNPFQHVRRRDGTSGGLGDVRASQALGGEGVFDPRVVRLTLEDVELDDTAPQSNDTAEDSDASTTFSPQLNIKCGPLLRYTGLRRDGTYSENCTAKEERETWRGSIMIVTTDDLSDYSPPPVIRLFARPASEAEIGETNGDASAEAATASTTGERLGARPAEGLPSEKDMPHEDILLRNVVTTRQVNDGEKLGKYKEVEATKLHAERGVTFWRFIVEVELGDEQARIAYRINHGPSIAFWVPARGQTMNIMFHSCNGFSLSVNPDDLCGPDPLWRDVLREHRAKPFHVMLGGGDQIYNDAVSKQTEHFKAWLGIKTPFIKSSHEFTPEMAEELEYFYLERYSMWFSQGLFGVANSQIAMVNIWDDHDIIDGFGSYPHHFNSCPVFTGLGAVAFKYYMLFQHQSIVDEKEEHEPSWVLGCAPGPYIAELSRSCFMFLGRKVAFLGLDCRTERMRDIVLSEESYDLVFERLTKEVVAGETKHLIVLLGVPIAYPRLVWLENIMTSRLMDPLKALGRMGYLGGFLNSFDGGVELLDDLDDHWTAKNHKTERNWFIERLQDFAAEKSVRITILGGDVHLAGIGQFFSSPKLHIPRENDHRYMPNVISSAIVNTPPPNAMADVLNKRNKVHHLNHETDEDMCPIFYTDVDGKPRNNKRLLPRRNYAIIREYSAAIAPLSETAQPPVKRSTFSKIKGATFGSNKSNKPDPLSNVRMAGVDGANTNGPKAVADRLGGDALDVVLRMEVDQKDPAGNTKPYRLLVPALKFEEDAADGGAHDGGGGGWI